MPHHSFISGHLNTKNLKIEATEVYKARKTLKVALLAVPLHHRMIIVRLNVNKLQAPI